MRDEVCFQKMVELIFVRDFKITAKMKAPNSTFPTLLLVNNFPEKLQNVLKARETIVTMKWTSKFINYLDDMAESTVAYLSRLFDACLEDHLVINQVFDSFLNACSLTNHICGLLYQSKGVNYSDLSYELIMEFYYTALKRTYLRRGGFNRLVDYVSKHRYLSWNLHMLELPSIHNPSTPFETALVAKFQKELTILQQTPRWAECDVLTTAMKMVEIVVKRTSRNVPSLKEEPASIETNAKVETNEDHGRIKPAMKFKSLQATSVKPPPLPGDIFSIAMADASGLTDEAETNEDQGKTEPLLVESFEPHPLPVDSGSIKLADISRLSDAAEMVDQGRIEPSQVASFEALPLSPDRDSIKMTDVSLLAENNEYQGCIEGVTKFEPLQVVSFEPLPLSGDSDSIKLTDVSLLAENNDQDRIEPATKFDSLQVSSFASQAGSIKMTDVPKLSDIAETNEIQERIEQATKFDSLQGTEEEYSTSAFKENYSSKVNGDIAWYERLLEAVVEYKNLNSSGFNYSENSILKKAGKVLEHLKDTIESLIEVLDDSDKE